MLSGCLVFCSLRPSPTPTPSTDTHHELTSASWPLAAAADSDLIVSDGIQAAIDEAMAYGGSSGGGNPNAAAAHRPPSLLLQTALAAAAVAAALALT